MRRLAGHVLAGEGDAAECWAHAAGDDIKKRRLACAVRADEPSDPARLNVERATVHGSDASVADVDVMDFDHAGLPCDCLLSTHTQCTGVIAGSEPPRAKERRNPAYSPSSPGQTRSCPSRRIFPVSSLPRPSGCTSPRTAI